MVVDVVDPASRPTIDEVMLTCARAFARRGTCSRLRVGAVLACDGRILATGYNGAPAGMSHCEHDLYRVPGALGRAPDPLSFDPPSWLLDYLNATWPHPWPIAAGVVYRRDNGELTVQSSPDALPPPCTRAVHAEANAVAFAARHGVPLDGATLYTTTVPCNACAMLTVNAGIARVVADAPFEREDLGRQLLVDAGIDVTVGAL